MFNSLSVSSVLVLSPVLWWAVWVSALWKVESMVESKRVRNYKGHGKSEQKALGAKRGSQKGGARARSEIRDPRSEMRDRTMEEKKSYPLLR